MQEYIDFALDRLANGVHSADRLTLTSMLRTGMPYMTDEQIDRTRALCGEVFFEHAQARGGSIPSPRPMTGKHPGMPLGAMFTPDPAPVECCGKPPANYEI